MQKHAYQNIRICCTKYANNMHNMQIRNMQYICIISRSISIYTNKKYAEKTYQCHCRPPGPFWPSDHCCWRYQWSRTHVKRFRFLRLISSVWFRNPTHCTHNGRKWSWFGSLWIQSLSNTLQASERIRWDCSSSAQSLPECIRPSVGQHIEQRQCSESTLIPLQHIIA